MSNVKFGIKVAFVTLTPLVLIYMYTIGLEFRQDATLLLVALLGITPWLVAREFLDKTRRRPVAALSATFLVLGVFGGVWLPNVFPPTSEGELWYVAWSIIGWIGLGCFVAAVAVVGSHAMKYRRDTLTKAGAIVLFVGTYFFALGFPQLNSVIIGLTLMTISWPLLLVALRRPVRTSTPD